nr:MAG TPA: Toll-like receptor 4,Variable lymphocyte receptor response, protein complex, small [Bacteriophage sp.]
MFGRGNSIWHFRKPVFQRNRIRLLSYCIHYSCSIVRKTIHGQNLYFQITLGPGD